jgi:polysaccharide biosynthesis/export protein
VRGSLAKPQIAIVNFEDIIKGKATDVILEPRDIVYVPLSPYRHLTKYADLIVTTFVRAIAINEGARAGGSTTPAGVSIGVVNFPTVAAPVMVR